MLYRILIVAIAVQVSSLVLIVYQTLSTTLLDRLPTLSWTMSEVLELMVVLSLATGSVITLLATRQIIHRNQKVEAQLAVAAATFQDFLSEKFAEWQLSESEREVALLTLKGFSVAEIAAIRSTSEGTIKAQNSAIYRKSSLSGRVQFISYFLEELTASI